MKLASRHGVKLTSNSGTSTPQGLIDEMEDMSFTIDKDILTQTRFKM